MIIRTLLAGTLALALVPARVPAPATSLDVSLGSRAMQPGELVVVTITTPGPSSDVTVRAFSHHAPTFQVDRLTWSALVGIDLDTPVGHYPVMADATIDGNRLETISGIDVKAKAFVTRQLSVDNAFVNPPASESKRIAQEAARLDALWKTETPKRQWDVFARPVAEEANSAFGSRSVYNGQARTPHTGADFLSPAGTPVHAPGAGTVVIAGPLYFTGNTVVIDHGLGMYSMLAHFSAIAVHEGDLVTAGQVVGRVGATGRVTGPHLHWAVRLNGARVDPLSVLAMLARPKAPARTRS